MPGIWIICIISILGGPQIIQIIQIIQIGRFLLFGLFGLFRLFQIPGLRASFA